MPGIELDTSSLTDEQLAAAAAREDSDGPSFNALVNRYQERVWRICFRLLSNEHDASDAAQEVFVRLFLHRGKFAGRSKYSTWVHGVAVRTCLTLRRGRSRRERRENFVRDRSAHATNVPATQAPGETLDLSQMLDTLDEDDRAMLILKYAEGHSYEDLAEMFDLSVSACKMRILRSRQRLQQRFPDHEF